MAIDVGAPCIDGGFPLSAANTLIEETNPANATGTINTVCVWAETSLSGIEYAAFTNQGGNVFSTNGDTNGSNLNATNQTIHTAAGNDFTAFAITAGDYIGLYYSGGAIGSTYSSNLWRVATNDEIPCTNTTFTYSSGWGALSLYGTGEEGGAPSTYEKEGFVIMHLYKMMEGYQE